MVYISTCMVYDVEYFHVMSRVKMVGSRFVMDNIVSLYMHDSWYLLNHLETIEVYVK